MVQCTDCLLLLYNFTALLSALKCTGKKRYINFVYYIIILTEKPKFSNTPVKTNVFKWESQTSSKRISLCCVYTWQLIGERVQNSQRDA